MGALTRRIRNLFSSNPKSAHNTEAVIAREMAFYQEYLREGMIVFDVGSNVGDLAVLFSERVGVKGHVHCFEPGEAAFAKLQRAAGTLRHQNVTLNRKAVGEFSGTVKFYVYPESHSAWNSMARRPLEAYGVQAPAPTSQEVECASIDDYCVAANISRVDLLKIDVEGAELQVLRGSRKMLNERRIRCCIFEFGQTTFDMGNRPKDFQAFFREVPYTLRNLISGDPLFPGGKSARTAQFAMLLATPKKS